GMDLFEIIALLISLTAVFGFLNEKLKRLPTTIGVMLFALAFSLVLLLLGLVSPTITESARTIIGSIDFSEAVMGIMLSYLLFAGSLHVNLDDLAQQRKVIGIMATAGVLLSTFLIGTVSYFLFRAIGFELRFIECLLFGSLISPTDPVAVLGILKVAGAPKSLKTKITGESLFNDGIGVVIFITLLGIAMTDTGHVSAGHIIRVFLVEALGGLLLGILLGFVGYRMIKEINNYQIEVLITLAMVTGGYALAQHLHTSGPLAMVAAGLLIGNQGRNFAMSAETRDHLDKFWELVDEVLNALLFVLIGLEVLIITIGPKIMLLGILSIPLVLAARYLAVTVPVFALRRTREFTPGVVPILTWAGLRGGISVALALSLPDSLGQTREVIITVTYIVVIFSISVQGLTLKSVIQKFTAQTPHSPGPKAGADAG
ncbi:MAG: sodium:proton antiporter, partial [Verrucomicrobiota bacterium]